MTNLYRMIARDPEVGIEKEEIVELVGKLRGYPLLVLVTVTVFDSINGALLLLL